MNIRSLLLLIPVLLALASCSSSSSTNSTQPDATPVATTVGQIQGSGSASPLIDVAVSVSGIVTGDFQDNDADTANNLGGFYLQSISPDSDAATSEGLFIFDGTAPATDVAIGDVVLVAGLFELERFGTVHLAAGDRPYSFTNQNLPDVGAYAAHKSAFASRSIFLDDGTTEQNIVPIRYLPSTLNGARTIRGGDSFTGLTGNLRFGRGDDLDGTEGYRLMPTIDPVIDEGDARPMLPARAGSLRIAGFNALNFFSTIDTGADDCGPSRSGECRGADSGIELERQLAKLATTLHMLDADIIGLIVVDLELYP
jgi:predicted extracellular nuclease